MLTWDDLTEEEKEDIISQTGEDEEFFEYYVSEFLTDDEDVEKFVQFVFELCQKYEKSREALKKLVNK